MPRKRKKIYIDVPYSLKNTAKTMGAMWDSDEKRWFIYDTFDFEALVNLLEENKKEGVSKKTVLSDGITKLKVPCFQKYQIDITDVSLKFKAALNAAGLEVDTPIMDGILRRVRVDGDKGAQKSGAYVCYLDGTPAGFIQNFKTGFISNWKYEKLDILPYSDKLIYSKKTQNLANDNTVFIQKQLQRENELEDEYKKTAKILLDEFLAANFAALDHAYFVRKRVYKNYGLKQDRFGNLLMPLFDINEKFWSLQRIFPNGNKMIGALLSNEQKKNGKKLLAKKRGNFFIISNDMDLYNKNSAKLNIEALLKYNKIYICEGFATAASVHEACKMPVIVGLDVGNLEFVVQNFSTRFCNIRIIIAADNDAKKEKESGVNIGKDKAMQIKNNFKNVSVCIPNFNDTEISSGYSDFNDLYNSRGIDEVGRQLEILL
ncbi:toprim domain-containing protein [Campylobacter concisus]|uniref:toprim domain-containing protein n=1 Tax=Campylobacter concisus TaxID=199 RepID=UPI000CD96E30|nr:toprim domain-containing protein [Campylobacter concisus]